VGERRFVSTRQTLIEESGYFASLLSGRWNSAQADGSYFVDADPNLFEHILRYLRRGVLPVFYEKLKGHDYAQYVALLEEAKYFQISRLEDWLEKKRYLHAFSMKHSAAKIEGLSDLYMDFGTDVDIEYYPMQGTKRSYVCPRGIIVHMDNAGACGRLCKNAQGDADDEYEEKPVLRTLVVTKQVVFDMQACLAER
jgi:hypothetical protein